MSTERPVALVTGASRGIGRATAVEFARHGYDVAILARSVELNDTTPWEGTIHETAKRVADLGGRAFPIRADLSKQEDVRRAVNVAMGEYGRVDVLVNNARHVSKAHWTPFMDTDWSEYDLMVDVNIKAPLLFCKLLFPMMIKQGGGVIVNVGTGSAVTEDPYPPGKGSTGLGYPVTKAALHRLGPALAREVVKQFGLMTDAELTSPWKGGKSVGWTSRTDMHTSD